GFAPSSYMIRELIPALAENYHVIAPDLPSFCFTESPGSDEYVYTFDNLAKTIDRFTEQLKLLRYAIIVLDYGAPVGCRLATAHQVVFTAIISQIGIAYEECLALGWDEIRRYWQSPTSDI
ncbi:alpha/beta fold hydrolase, partial [Pectobacterium brasiliense]|uniref:alpha/beta fold hydrolase n=1 Tax=Pectobacterium brasiliense TaxID=180957 RepID=UPI001968FF24